MVGLHIVEELPAETSNQTLHRSLARAATLPIASWTDDFRPGTLGEKAVMMPESLLATQAVVVNIGEEPPAETNNQTANASRFTSEAAGRSILHLKHLWARYFMLGEEAVVTTGSVPANLVVEPNTTEEFPVETNNQAAYFRRGTLGEDRVMTPRHAFKIVIMGLFGFAAFKFQGGTRSPLQTCLSTVSITSLLMYGLASYAAPPGSSSVYAFAARLVGKLCLYVFVVTLASLLIFLG